MIYPLYGQGELPQAFCRRAAVKGSIYVLGMPVVGLLADKEVGNYKGVKLVSGQELFSHKLILAPSFILPSGLAPSYSHPQRDVCHDFGLQGGKEKVVRGICITKNSLKPDVENCLVFYPPRSLCLEQLTSVRVFQLSSYVAACPSGISTFMPDGNLQYNNLLDATTKLFQKMCPNEEFFPKTPSSNEVTEDSAFEQLAS